MLIHTLPINQCTCSEEMRWGRPLLHREMRYGYSVSQKVYYVRVAKAASTSIFKSLEQSSEGWRLHGNKRQWRGFSVVRHPIDRALSGVCVRGLTNTRDTRACTLPHWWCVCKSGCVWVCACAALSTLQHRLNRPHEFRGVQGVREATSFWKAPSHGEGGDQQLDR